MSKHCRQRIRLGQNISLIFDWIRTQIMRQWHEWSWYTKYSRVRNKHSPTLINFLTFFQGLRPYSGLHRAYFSSIRYKWGYAYSFCQIFQGLCLFKGLRLFQTLEYYVFLYIYYLIKRIFLIRKACFTTQNALNEDVKMHDHCIGKLMKKTCIPENASLKVT